MSQFPAGIDSDTDLPRVDDNITSIGAAAINALRDAVFAIEANIGINAQGAALSIAGRLNTSLDPLGRILPSALAGLGLVYLPITDSEISPTAGIEESKLNLIYSTSTLYNLYQNLANSIAVLNGFLSLVGVKLEPHIDGTAYNHDLSAIFVDAALPMLKTLPGANVALPGTSVQNRNTTNADTLVKDISDDLLTHETANGLYPLVVGSTGTVPPEGFAHVATGLWIDTSSFAVVPQSNNSLQSFAEFVDSSSLLLLGSRTQNLFSNGVSVAARASLLTADGYGQSIVPPTPVIAYLLNVPPGPIAASPVDDINHGDDVVLFQPTAQQLSTFNIDAQFAQVSAGDLITINYGNGITAQFTVDSVKAIVSGINRTYAVRLNGKNLYSTSDGVAQINRPLYTTNKYGVLATARCPNSMGILESLIIAHPRAAMVLGNGFNTSEFDNNHYNLYLTLFANGDPTAPLSMPAVDLTGNKGATPGQYTLDAIVNNANVAFRAPGFNLRFIAFEYQGQFGIMLAESYNNAAFSIISGTVNSLGQYTSSSNSSYPANVVDNYGTGIYPIDPLGFGQIGANIASPPPATSYSSVGAAQFAPSLLFYPKRNMYYYVNGVETDLLKSDPLALNQIEDGYGDGYWPATILPSPASMAFPNRVQATYQVNLNLSTSGLGAGKTVVIQPAFPTTDPRYNFRDYGRFIIQSVSFSGCDTSNPITNIVVYDAVHATGSTPAVTSTNIPVLVYFSDDSVAFNAENVADQSSAGLPYTRFFELYVNTVGHTWAHERARFSVPGTSLANINFSDVSPKLTGYPTQIATGEFGQALELIVNSYSATTGIFVGQLVNPNAPSVNYGPLTTGKKGQPVRFYDETNVDYIDFIFNATATIPTWSSPLSIQIQVFPSLELDQESFLLSGCQVSDVTGQVSNIIDKRQYGNTSEQNFTTSALDYIAAPTRLLNENGIVRGFDEISTVGNQVQFDGGEAVVNGNILQLNPQTIEIPAILEAINGSISNNVNVITWFVCINQEEELQLIASTDFDPAGSFVSQYAGLDNTRLFYGMNPNLSSPAAYPIRGTYFGDLVMNQTDLVPIAVIVATTTSVGGTYVVSSLTYSDARRFTYRGTGGIGNIFILGPNGSFRSLPALSTWLNQLNNYESATVGNSTINLVGNRVLVKGETVISSPVTINVKNPVSFIGDGGGFQVASAQGIIVTNGVTFENVRFDYTYIPTIGEGYLTSSLINSFNAAIYCDSASSNQNITIKNCTFNSFNSNHYPFISFELTTNQAVLQNVIVKDNIIVSNSGTQDLRAAIVINSKAPTFSATFPYFPKLNNIIIENNLCNNDQMIAITSLRSGVVVPGPMAACTNVRITGNTCGTIGFLTSYDIISTSDNSNYSGIVHDKADTLTINHNTCKFISNIDGYLGQYISFQTLATYGPGLNAPINSSLQWEPATFAVSSATITSPTLMTVVISTTSPSAFTSGTDITIVGLTGGITPTHVYDTPITVTGTTINSVTFTVAISGGSGGPSNTGYAYVLFDIINNGTGPFTISDNTCNWIQVGTYSDIYGGGDGVISGNRLFPYIPTFLQNYTDTICSVSPVNAAIMLNPDSGQQNTNSIISNNIMSVKVDYSNPSHVYYTYDYGILSFNNVSIIGNSINSTSTNSCMTSSLANTIMICIGGDSNIVTNNTLTRGAATGIASISAYINGAGNSPFFNPEFLVLSQNGTVINNIFDSIYIDTANTVFNDANIIFGSSAEYNSNINQVLYTVVPVSELFVTSAVSAAVEAGAAQEPAAPNSIQGVRSMNSAINFGSGAGCGLLSNTTLSKYVPAGATLLYAVVGIKANDFNANDFTPSTSSLFGLAATKQPSAAFTPSTISTSIVSIYNTYSQIIGYYPSAAKYPLTTGAELSALIANVQYLELDFTSATTIFSIGKDSDIKIYFEATSIDAPSTNTYLDVSPITIRYTFS